MRTTTPRAFRPRVASAALAVVAFAVLAPVATGCGGDVQPEKTETETFGCYVGECVPAAVEDAGSDAGADADATRDS